MISSFFLVGFGVGVGFATNYWVFLTLRFCSAFANVAIFTTSYVYREL